MGEKTIYICPDCGIDMELKESGSLLCPKCYRSFRKSTYDFIHDLGMHDARILFKEEHNEEPPNPNAVVLTRDEVMCSTRDRYICQFRYGIETQHFSAKEVVEWLRGDKYVYGETWRCWSDMPSKQQEKETPWEALWETDGSTSKPPLGCPPHYTYVCSRIEDLCNAIVRCYADWKPNHNKIAMWCKEIMYLNEMDRNLRYEEKRKVWKEDEDGKLQEMP